MIEQISARCEMLSREITAMLQLANLRSRAQNPPPPVLIELPALIRSCLANLRPQAARRGIAFDEDLPDASVWGIHDHAVDDHRQYPFQRDPLFAGRAAGLGVLPGAARRRGAVSSSATSGIGIPADKLPRIFDDYFRTKEAAAHNQASTGLGLAIVRQAALAGKSAFAWKARRGRARFFRSISPLRTTPEN